MENNALIIICVAEVVLLVVFIISIIRYFKKDTLLSLILYVVSSIGICTLEIVSTLIKTNLDQSYVHELINAFIFAVNALLGVFFMGDRFGRKKVEVTIKIIDTDKSNDNED